MFKAPQNISFQNICVTKVGLGKSVNTLSVLWDGVKEELVTKSTEYIHKCLPNLVYLPVFPRFPSHS